MTHGRFDPARFDELLRVSEEVVAAIQRLPGFQHYHGGADRAAGTLVAVSVWDSEEHARFSRDALGDVIARVQAAGIELEPPALYEVISHA